MPALHTTKEAALFRGLFYTMEKKERVMDVLATVLLYVLIGIVLLPCLLAFTEGVNGEPTIWKVIGIAYMIMLVFAVKKIRHHVRQANKD